MAKHDQENRPTKTRRGAMGSSRKNLQFAFIAAGPARAAPVPLDGKGYHLGDK